MTASEVFAVLKAHMLEGMVFHDEMKRYFGFLGLEGYSGCHAHHYHEETEGYHRLCEYYVSHYNEMIPIRDMKRPDVIPDSWYRANRKDVDTSTKRSAVKDGFQKWVKWEKETKSLYEEMTLELIQMEEIASAEFIKQYVCDVDDELARADKKHIQLETVGYDIGYIMADQH